MVRRLNAIVLLLAVVLGVVGASLVFGGGSHTRVGAFRPNQELVLALNRSATTSNTDFAPLPVLQSLGGANYPALSGGGVAATLSGVFVGAPVELRVTRDEKPLRPGRVPFDPGTGPNSASFTFVVPVFGGKTRCRRYALEWRSPTGQPVTFRKGTLDLRFHRHIKRHQPICE